MGVPRPRQGKIWSGRQTAAARRREPPLSRPCGPPSPARGEGSLERVGACAGWRNQPPLSHHLCIHYAALMNSIEISDTGQPCAFCANCGPRLNSHVLPAFVYRWLRNRSGTGHIRDTDNIDRRVQDGIKLPWLCAKCENLFSKYETAFANNVFYPWLKEEKPIVYDERLLKFCTSVSWRVLRFARGQNKDAKYTPEQEELMDRAEQRWRDFINGLVAHPGDFEQHLVIFNVIENTSLSDLPTNMNRFMTGAVTLDIVGSERSIMTFAKLGRFMIFGLIQGNKKAWQGTKIHVSNGFLKPDNVSIPGGLLYMFKEKAALAAAAVDSMSPRQRAKVDLHIRGNLDQFLESELFAAIKADARMFGENAVIWKE